MVNLSLDPSGSIGHSKCATLKELTLPEPVVSSVGVDHERRLIVDFDSLPAHIRRRVGLVFPNNHTHEENRVPI